MGRSLLFHVGVSAGGAEPLIGVLLPCNIYVLGHLFSRLSVCRGLVLEFQELTPPLSQEHRHSYHYDCVLYRGEIKSGRLNYVGAIFPETDFIHTKIFLFLISSLIKWHVSRKSFLLHYDFTYDFSCTQFVSGFTV